MILNINENTRDFLANILIAFGLIAGMAIFFIAIDSNKNFGDFLEVFGIILLWFIGLPLAALLVIWLWAVGGEWSNASGHSHLKVYSGYALRCISAVLCVAILFVITGDSSSSKFADFECTEDCSGHEAGYQWAEENDILNPDDCDGNSDSFVEGCLAFADEN